MEKNKIFEFKIYNYFEFLIYSLLIIAVIIAQYPLNAILSILIIYILSCVFIKKYTFYHDYFEVKFLSRFVYRTKEIKFKDIYKVKYSYFPRSGLTLSIYKKNRFLPYSIHIPFTFDLNKVDIILEKFRAIDIEVIDCTKKK